ncbi:formate dehydrogenase formation protein [Desulfacinum hydrothermale DSM 13146]|uniref:Formate dehydrogenase formation protein n=1 Tax=Desulfacinum hydrothermale DSM 13146 TaxID=1121390 RepID=A0A1W1XCP2_9BACT|nr:formate dehydrogenase accessory protein FdhE [Desulfacinum hydrothermale]SMC21622.1 formate dehydrogenase formation protein [Desulfacinum hydrothermale DSM 13146]
MQDRQASHRVRSAVEAARKSKPAYEHLFSFLEPLFTAQQEIQSSLQLRPLDMEEAQALDAWREGRPLLKRWEFPIDGDAAERMLAVAERAIPEDNGELGRAHQALEQALARNPSARTAIWESFLHHEWNPWEEWVDMEGVEAASLLFLARSCLRPSVEWTARDLCRRFSFQDHWREGYCPVCGSLPSLLTLEDQGRRWAHCSWCGTAWPMARLQCPACDNRRHDRLGYLYTEQEPHYRIYYCQECACYFKALDRRELLSPLWVPLEEWTTLHLDLVAQRAGWKTPPSPAPAVYGDGAEEGRPPLVS